MNLLSQWYVNIDSKLLEATVKDSPEGNIWASSWSFFTTQIFKHKMFSFLILFVSVGLYPCTECNQRSSQRMPLGERDMPTFPKDWSCLILMSEVRILSLLFPILFSSWTLSFVPSNISLVLRFCFQHSSDICYRCVPMPLPNKNTLGEIATLQ